MRTLSKPQKQKVKSQQKEKQEKKEGKGASKKVIKTVFQTPFRYKMYTLTNTVKPFPCKTKVIFQKY